MAFCVYCGIELPQAARFCFKCGKAVMEDGEEARRYTPPVKAVPLIENEHRSSDEFVRVAHSLTSIDEDAAAVVVYAPRTAQGTNVSLHLDRLSAAPVQLAGQSLIANIIGRQAGGRVVYVAVFPRIVLNTLDGKKANITHATCQIRGCLYIFVVNYCIDMHLFTLYPGRISEVDWSWIDYRPDEVED